MASNTRIELGVLRPETTTTLNASRLEPTAAASNGQPDTFNIEHEFSLPPVDRGKDAWSFLGAAFVVEILVWGTCEIFIAVPSVREQQWACTSSNI